MNPILLLAVSVVMGSPTDAPNLQQDPTSSFVAQQRGPGGPPRGENPPQDDAKKDEDPWAKAVKDFKEQSGMFSVFTKDDEVLFAVPENLLTRDLLWYIELKGAPTGSYSGQSINETLVRFEKRGDSLILRQVRYNVRDTVGDMKVALEKSTVSPILAVLKIKATDPKKGILVDVGSFFNRGLREVPFASAVGGQVDGSRSFIDRVIAFPENINVEATITGMSQGAGGGGRFGGGLSGTNTAVVHHSLLLLPEKPMQGRLWDSRVGYFSNSFTDYGSRTQGTREYRFISRYKLEKKDPRADMSEPVEPIVYYISNEVPEKYREACKKGIEDWRAAFEAAGFKNAIIAKDAPTPEQDPNWSPEDARYSVIRWAPLPIPNAIGPSVTDPRSGEIMNAHVILWHDVIKLGAEWYFSQASAADPRAQSMPLPDDLMSEIIRFVVAHEVGHTLGLPHNGKSSAMVPTELLRSKQWTEANGTAGSIMDYARFNYVAQPGDGARLMPMVGAYDKFSIMWGYKPILAANPFDEVSTLDVWAARQVNEPLLRFYDNFNGADPTAQAEALGDDAVVASTYGVMNLKKSIGYLSTGMTKFGEDYSEMNRFYGSLWGQFNRYVGHVMVMVGGVVETDYHAGRGGDVYNAVPKDRQKAAVKWLIDNVMETPDFLVPNSLLRKVGPNSGMSRISSGHGRVVNGLLSDSRLNRMLDNELMSGSKAYSVREMMGDVRANVWRELGTANPVVGQYRQSAQRSWVTALISKLPSSSSTVRAYALAELRESMTAINGALPKAKELVTKQHLGDLKLMIEQAFTFPPASPAAAGGAITFPFGARDEDWISHDGCGFCRATGKE